MSLQVCKIAVYLSCGIGEEDARSHDPLEKQYEETENIRVSADFQCPIATTIFFIGTQFVVEEECHWAGQFVLWKDAEAVQINDMDFSTRFHQDILCVKVANENTPWQTIDNGGKCDKCIEDFFRRKSWIGQGLFQRDTGAKGHGVANNHIIFSKDFQRHGQLRNLMQSTHFGKGQQVMDILFGEGIEFHITLQHRPIGTYPQPGIGIEIIFLRNFIGRC